MADNTITVVGNLTRDPELRFTQTGRARALLGVAVNRRWMNRQTNEWEEQVSFFNVVCWAETGRERQRVAGEGQPCGHHGQTRAAELGDPGRRTAQHRRDRRRRDRTVAALGNGRDHAYPARDRGVTSGGARERRPASSGWDGGDAPAQHTPEEEPF